MKTKYEFFVDNKRYETDEQFLTGKQIKDMAQAKPNDGLLLEGQGHNPDEVIPDDKKVDLSPDHGGVKRFRLEPPANFGSVP